MNDYLSELGVPKFKKGDSVILNFPGFKEKYSGVIQSEHAILPQIVSDPAHNRWQYELTLEESAQRVFAPQWFREDWLEAKK